MPRFAANISLLFTELPFLDRFAAARDAGFEGVECLFPYDWPVSRVRRALEAAGLPLVLFNLPPGRWAAGERGIAALPGREAEFRDGLARALEYAAQLQCPRLHCMAGIPAATLCREQVWATFADNLALAADRAAQQGCTLTLEPINTRLDMPGYLLDDPDDAIALMAQVGRDNIRLQCDLYHLWVMGRQPIPFLRANGSHIEHIQFADAPGRHEPGSGVMPLVQIFDELDARGYPGWVSAEYHPAGATVEGLAWLNDGATNQ